MKSLEKIDLSSNRLTSFPPSIFALPALLYINFKRNRITEITLPLHMTNTIQSLDCSENNITAFPFRCYKLPLLKVFRFVRNPAFYPSTLTDEIEVKASKPFIPSLRHLCESVIINGQSDRRETLTEFCEFRLSYSNQQVCDSCYKIFTHAPNLSVAPVEIHSGRLLIKSKCCSQSCREKINQSA